MENPTKERITKNTRALLKKGIEIIGTGLYNNKEIPLSFSACEDQGCSCKYKSLTKPI
jgi:hypothetical protein